MHLVTRPSMLTLTVERMVGSGQGHGRLTLSPDSSDTGSESSSSVTVPPATQHFTAHKISLLLSPEPRPKSDERSPPAATVVREMSPNLVEDCPTCQRSPSPGTTAAQRLECERVGEGEVREEVVITVIPERPSKTELSPRAAAPILVQHGLVSIGDNEGHCDDERPPSGASGGSSSTSTWNSWATLATSTSPGRISEPPGSHNSSSKQLKFSIQNILREDFGQGAVTKSRSNSSIDKQRSHPFEPNNGHGGLDGHNRRDNERSRAVERRQRRLSSRNISEDSNSSCASSRREEVVDESKVNPEVPKGPLLWPAWVYCTRYSDRPSSGPRSRRVRKKSESSGRSVEPVSEEKRPRTAFTAEQLGKLRQEFEENRYLTEKRRQDLANDLKLHENQIKIWFQNRRAKLKKSKGERGGLAIQLMAQGLYNHSTVPMDEDEEDYLPC